MGTFDRSLTVLLLIGCAASATLSLPAQAEGNGVIVLNRDVQPVHIGRNGGKDPYPTTGHPVGLSFSVAPDVRPVPRSLQNIYQELGTDLGLPTPATGDLTPWFERGVMLLNRVLTVQPGRSASHQGKGWETVTAQAISALVGRGGPLVAILWGRQAQSLAPMLGSVPRIESAHPSPLSARSGFFGSRPFSRTNDLLAQQGAPPIDWRLT